LKKEPYKRRWGNQFTQSYDDDFIEQLADDMLEWFEISDGKKPKNFWLRDFAIQKRIGRQRLSEFAKQNTYFSFVYEICKDLQESYLFKLGMSKSVNAGMPAFALKNVAGWRDSFDVGLDLPEQYLETLKQEALKLMQQQL
jgi:hypothetical protein